MTSTHSTSLKPVYPGVPREPFTFDHGDRYDGIIQEPYFVKGEGMPLTQLHGFDRKTPDLSRLAMEDDKTHDNILPFLRRCKEGTNVKPTELYISEYFKQKGYIAGGFPFVKLTPHGETFTGQTDYTPLKKVKKRGMGAGLTEDGLNLTGLGKKSIEDKLILASWKISDAITKNTKKLVGLFQKN